jgi:[Skp1-protein]-hydroxyproline N-acetylglucosaminyltransferase
LNWAYEKAKNPEKLFVGLVQQNCHKDCKSGILDGGKVETVEPDVDCYKTFCSGPNSQYCDQVRVLDVDEPESLGPYAARHFASKLWYGEQWFMQTDAHMTFAQDWDATSVQMLQACPSKKPVISHYPPSHMADLEKMAGQPASRLCGPIFATSDLESQIIRLEGASVSTTYYSLDWWTLYHTTLPAACSPNAIPSEI